MEIRELNISEDEEIFLAFIDYLKSDSEKFRYYNTRDHKVVKNHLSTLIVIDEDNKIVGYAHLDFEEKYWFGIYLSPEIRRMGFGVKLWKRIKSKAKTYRIDCIFLTVDIDNIPAISLYKKLGFKQNKKEKYFIEFRYDI